MFDEEKKQCFQTEYYYSQLKVRQEMAWSTFRRDSYSSMASVHLLCFFSAISFLSIPFPWQET